MGSQGWQEIPVVLSLVSSIFTVGATFGLYIRRGREFDEFKCSNRSELDLLWKKSEDCERDRRRLSERIVELGGHP